MPESVRIDPALQAQLAARAEAEGITVSDLIRRALQEYLPSA
jgi:predicted HicB family RNase H-like nuclease